MKKHIIVLLILIISTISGCACNSDNNNHKNSISTKNTSQKQVQTSTSKNVLPAATSSVEETAKEDKVDPPVNNESHSWYLTLNSTHQIPYVDPEIQTLLAKNNAFYVLPNNSNKIFLTFDCGYELGYTGQIMDILKVNQIKAAFFITGHYLHSQPELVKRMKAEGHLVCNHTLNHPDLSTLTSDKIQQELTDLEQEYTSITGMPMDKYLRPPMGNYSALSLQAANQAGYSTVFWSLAFRDWDPNNQPGAEYSHQYVIDNIHPGAVILLHAVSESDTEALDQIVKDLQNQGYIFATFDNRS